MDANQAFMAIQHIVKTNANYVPRNYESVGGMWTVDTWKLGEFRVQLEDEGYTMAVFAPGLVVRKMAYNGLAVTTGTEDDLVDIAYALLMNH